MQVFLTLPQTDWADIERTSVNITSSELACVRVSCLLHVGQRMSSVGENHQSRQYTAAEAVSYTHLTLPTILRV